MTGESMLTVIGQLTADPELRYTQSGAAVLSFTVASTPRGFDGASGQWRDGQTLYLRCSMFRQPAENAAESFMQGSRVIVYGKVTQRSFETSDGDKRTVIEIVVEEVGASVKYATAAITKRTRPGSKSDDEAWATPWADNESMPATPVKP
jgi:single-strand DNA-binding protein